MQKTVPIRPTILGLVVTLFISATAHAANMAPTGPVRNAAEAPAATPFNSTGELLPVPAAFNWGEGSFRIDSSLGVQVKGVQEDRVSKGVARFLARLGKRTSLTFTSGKNSIVIECKAKGLPIQTVREDESYTLDVTSDGV